MTASTSCPDVRPRLLAYQRGTLEPGEHEAVRIHLESCAACGHEDAAEATLSLLLERRLPQHPAPIALKRRLRAAWPPTPAPAAPRLRWWRPAGVAAVAALLTLLVSVGLRDQWPSGGGAFSGLAQEAVNDHLRLVDQGRSLEVVSSDIHEVRPWFTGRLDFAPVVPFAGDRDFPLRGGAIEQFLDRKAAALVYSRRRHAASLLVLRAEGLRWPPPSSGRHPEPAAASIRGFNVLLWRAGDLGYLLVSDLPLDELGDLARRLMVGPHRP